MPEIAIKFDNISKQYRIGEIGTGTLSHDINRWWHKVRGKEDPYLKVGSTNEKYKKSDSDYIWALKNINLEVKQGEVLGIIGKNGAGKSTLLKILSKVTRPTTGMIKTKGRIASLLEVGTGFHPEMTGRENVYMNGSIMGMTKAEITRKFDEIVDFAGIEQYIDTPVKRYSSGMIVRLGFAIAAHLEPEILVVDEVLAVGDADFQKKAIGKMQNVTHDKGRTILFVSHNMGAIQSLCRNCVILENGNYTFYGEKSEAIAIYLDNSKPISNTEYINKKPRNDSDILSICVTNSKFILQNNFSFNEPIQLIFELKLSFQHLNAVLGFRIKDQFERNVFTSQVKLSEYFNKEGTYKIMAEIPSSFLVPNKYFLIVGLHIVNIEIIRQIDSLLSFNIEETGTDFFQYHGNDYGCVFCNCNWMVHFKTT